VVVGPEDFAAAMQQLVPASHRAAAPAAAPLPPPLRPLCAAAVNLVVQGLKVQFPPSLGKAATAAAQPPPPQFGNPGAWASSSSSSSGGSNGGVNGGNGSSSDDGAGAALPFGGGGSSSSLGRARLLVCGPAGCGQRAVALAALHHLEELPTFVLDLPALLADPSHGGAAPASVQASRARSPSLTFLFCLGPFSLILSYRCSSFKRLLNSFFKKNVFFLSPYLNLSAPSALPFVASFIFVVFIHKPFAFL
jgi:hypothetical protein